MVLVKTVHSFPLETSSNCFSYSKFPYSGQTLRSAAEEVGLSKYWRRQGRLPGGEGLDRTGKGRALAETTSCPRILLLLFFITNTIPSSVSSFFVILHGMWDLSSPTRD